MPLPSTAATPLPRPPWPPLTAGPPAADGAASLARALRRAGREGPGGVVLRVEERAPHRRKVARALLQEGALAAGGQVLDGPGGDLLLVGAEPRRAARLQTLVERLVGPAGTQIWSLERDAAALLAYAAGEPATPGRPMSPGPDLAALDGYLEALPLDTALRRSVGRGTAAAERPAFLRLEPDRARIAAGLGPLGADADLLDHAVRRLAARLLAALARPEEARALFGVTRPTRLHLPLPQDRPAANRPPAPPGALVATLPLAALADPPRFAARQAALAAAGIGLELEGLDAAALALLDPAALPPAWLRLRWSPRLAAPAARAALAALDPACLVLAEATDAAAEAFARALHIPLIEAELP